MDPWRRFETKISTKEREGEKTLSTRPSPPPDDSFSNGFLTHRIPSRDNVHDSSRASCVHKGKVAGIDRLFPRFSLSLLRVNIILISAEIWNGVERVRAWMHRSGVGIEIPIFNARFSNAVSPRNSRHSFTGFSRIENSIFKLFPILRDGCSVMFVAVKISRQVRFSSRLFRIYAVSGFRIQN